MGHMLVKESNIYLFLKRHGEHFNIFIKFKVFVF